ncbi:MAG: tetratricopeptide repeat protein [Candidatus Omnitrophica bacterium]|nr:tetratricopeptide repeat protein [Candidatus Omnitrophota bacterium]
MKKIVFFLIIVFMLAGCRGTPESENERKIFDARGLIIKALEELNNKDIQSATRNLQEAVKKDPSQIEAFFLLGQVYLRAKEPEEALYVFEYAAHLFGDNGTVFYMLAIAYHEVGRNPEALAAARRSVELFSQNQREEVFKNAMIKAVFLWHEFSAESIRK